MSIAGGVEHSLLKRTVSEMYGLITCDKSIGKFFSSNLSSFVRLEQEEGVEHEEHLLEWTELHNEFLELIESRLESFARTQQFSSPSAFFQALKEEVVTGGRASASSSKENRMMTLLLASYEYEKFVSLMRIKARNRLKKWEEEKAEEGKEEEEESKDYNEDGKSDGSIAMFADSEDY